MKWIQGKPKPIKHRHRQLIKYKGFPDMLTCYHGTWYWYDESDSKFSESNIVKEDSWSAIEWLDELSASQSTSVSTKANGEAEDVGGGVERKAYQLAMRYMENINSNGATTWSQIFRFTNEILELSKAPTQKVEAEDVEALLEDALLGLGSAKAIIDDTGAMDIEIADNGSKYDCYQNLIDAILSVRNFQQHRKAETENLELLAKEDSYFIIPKDHIGIADETTWEELRWRFAEMFKRGYKAAQSTPKEAPQVAVKNVPQQRFYMGYDGIEYPEIE